MRPKITVHADIARNTWLATFHDDQEVQELFGTDTLPTSFTLLEEGEVVRREVERKNPSARVRLVHRNGTVYDPEDARDHLPRVKEDQHGGDRFEMPDSWMATVEELWAEGAISVEEHEARQAERWRLKLNC